ncbi:MAG: alkaline phosphatase family protein [Bacteroidales bacterium]|jgi:predicted AlkP superfamily pyrophosphatase or phosphodiesterase
MTGLRKLMSAGAIPVLLFASTGLYCQNAYIPPEKPRLVIGIVVEELRYDQVEKFRNRFAEDGIRRLLNEGTYFQNASYQYILTQSDPGYATIATGAEPYLHGITSDNWYLPLKNELMDCSKDVSVNPVGGSYESGLHSPVNLLVSTFPDELKMATGRKAKVFSVGLKDAPVIFSAGHAANGAYWFDNTSGTWMSSTYYLDSLPAWVKDFNAMKYPASFLSNQWTLSRPLRDYSDCMPDSNKFEAGFNGICWFPYDLKRLSAKGKGGADVDYSLLRETPFGNTLTTNFAIRLIEKEKLGKGDATDFLSICYSATDYIGHRFGPSSMEMADAIFRLDSDIEHLLKYITDSIGKKNVLIYFTSAHGISEIPGVLQSNRIPAGYFMKNFSLQLLRTYLNAVYGEGDWVKGFLDGQIYLNRTLLEDSKIPLEEMQKKVARFMVQFSGVASAYTYSSFEAGNFGNGEMNRIFNDFNPQRSGDVIVTLNSGWIEKEDDYVAVSNSPYEYDSHVPLIWYGWSVNRAMVTRKVNLTDIAATLSALCKVPYPNACSGEPMFELYR